MLIGLLSDTHGDLVNARRGFDLLKRLGVEQFIHAGDVGDEPIFDLFAGEKLSFVWGNNDYDRDALHAYAAGLGLSCLEDAGTVEIGGRSIGVTHGDNPCLVKLLTSKCNYVIVGHSHVATEQREGMTRLINPGALHRAKIKTVATLDLASDGVTWFEIATAQPIRLSDYRGRSRLPRSMS